MERTPKRGAECDIDFGPDGFRVKPKPSDPAKSGSVLSQFLINEEKKDYLVCVKATSNLGADATGRAFTEETSTVLVAKAPVFRVSLFDVVARGGSLIGEVDGVRYTYANSAPFGRRTALITSAVATPSFGAAQISMEEEIYPPYTWTPRPGETASPSKGLIYAMKCEQGAVINSPDGQVEYIDVTPGRTWQLKLVKVRTCVEGQAGPWFVLFRASGSFTEV